MRRPVALEPLKVKWPCPRGYETATGIWEESGVPDHCAGCGCNMKAHAVETQRQVNEQVVFGPQGVDPSR